MSAEGTCNKVIELVRQWDGVEISAHRYGGFEFRLGRRELGHIHGDYLVDIPFPKKVRDEVVNSGQAQPHHILPNSGWVSIYVRSPEDAERAMRLLELSFSLAQSRKSF